MYTGHLKFTTELTEESHKRLERFFEGSCQDCIITLVNKTCDVCLKKIKPIRVPFVFYTENGEVLGIEWDGQEKPYHFLELLKALVLMMRQFEPNFGLSGLIINEKEGLDIITVDGMPCLETEIQEEFSGGAIKCSDNMFSLEETLSHIGDLTCDVRITIENSKGFINCKVWERQYNGHQIIIDGEYNEFDLTFYFLEEDFQKYCIDDKSVVFVNMFNNKVKRVAKQDLQKIDFYTTINLQVSLNVSTEILREQECEDFIIKNISLNTDFFNSWGNISVDHIIVKD